MNSPCVVPQYTESMPIAAIILAAGASRRLGEPKQLLQFRGEALLARAIRLAAEAGCAPVLAVVGAHIERIQASVQFDSAIPVFNESWEQGIASSIHAGLHSLETCSPPPAGVLLMSCDQPRLTADHLRTLIESFLVHGASSIAASVYADALGVPAVFPPAIYPQLLALQGDKGARQLLASSAGHVLRVPFEGGEVDIDLPADRALLS